MNTPIDPMPALIERAAHGLATTDELERLARWRAESADHERDYRRTLRLLELARATDRDVALPAAPSAAALLAGRAQREDADRDATNARRPAGGSRRAATWLPWGVAAAAVLALLLLRGPAATTPALGVATDVSTGPSELATVHLDDGSVVRLAPSTRLQVTPRADAREVRLDGRAHFSVAPDATRPFRVRTRPGDVEVIGTRFDVSTRAEDLQLIVVEGRVSLSAGGGAVEVGGGEISGVANGALIPPRQVVNPDSALRWVGTFIVFRSTPLAEAAREIERVYGVRIRIPDPAIAARTVTATFADQEAHQVAAVLCTVVDARCTTEADGTIVITR